MWHWEQVAPRICWNTEDCHSAKVRSMSPPGGAWMSWQLPHIAAEFTVSRSRNSEYAAW